MAKKKKHIKIRISPDGGTVEVDAVGFQGKGCVETIGKLLKAGKPAKIVKEQHKPEFHRRDDTDKEKYNI